MAGKAGVHRRGKYAVEIAEDGKILVKSGDWLSKYSAAIHGGDTSRVHEYGRMGRGAVEPILDVDRIRAGETIYHIPTYEAYQAGLASEKVKAGPQPKAGPPVATAPKKTDSVLRGAWLGVGVQVGGRVIFGRDSVTGYVYNLGDPSNAVRYAGVVEEGASIVLGLGGGGSLVALFGYGANEYSDLNTAKVDFDWAFSPGTKVGDYLKSLKHITKLRKVGPLIAGAAEASDEYKKLKYVGEQLIKSKVFKDPGMYSLPIPFTGFAVEIHAGARASESTVFDTGTLDFTS